MSNSRLKCNHEESLLTCPLHRQALGAAHAAPMGLRPLFTTWFYKHFASTRLRGTGFAAAGHGQIDSPTLPSRTC